MQQKAAIEYFKNLGILEQDSEKDFKFISPNYQVLEPQKLYLPFFKPRDRFAHKGSFGHALLCAGSYGKAGAAILAAKACLRSGCGLVSLHIPKQIYQIVQISFPEAMTDVDNGEMFLTKMPCETKYSSVAIGPGIDTKEETAKALLDFLTCNTKPLLLDADALNIIAKIKGFGKLLKPSTILTPHPKEFERLFGLFTSEKERLDFALSFSKRSGVTLVLKGGITTICTPEGKVFFNTIGNPGMATAGSGDVLSGIITSLQTQGVPTSYAAATGVYIHALAGDFACGELGEQSIIASDIIANIPKAINYCKEFLNKNKD